jgi:ABC-type transport system substrate-binding protein
MWEATMEGTGEIAWLPVPSQHWAYSPDLVPSFEYDPEAARALLEEAGVGDGFTISMTSAAGQDAVRRAEIMQAQLAEIGITVEITPEQTVDSVQSYFTDKRMDSFNTSMTSRPDPSITFQTVFSADSFYNTGAISPDGFEELLQAAKAAQTLEERQEAFHALNEAVVENALWVPLVYPASTTAHTDQFAGFVPSLIGKPDFTRMYQAG